jgi:hypothetical protein
MRTESRSAVHPVIWRAGLCLIAVVLTILSGNGPVPTVPALAQSSTPLTFKIAYWNVQAGSGEGPLPGHASTFDPAGSCVAPPLNAWGVHVVQDELLTAVGNDPAVVALGLSEAWICATPSAIQQVLGWKARSSSKNGTAIVARHGFGGAEQWLQLDTSTSANPNDTAWVLRIPVCLNAGCTQTIDSYTVHLYGPSLVEATEYANYVRQAQQTIAFASQSSGDQPHVLIGDFNVFEGTSIVCGQKPKNETVRTFREAGYLDAWAATHGPADGSTGMWNRAGCGSPVGNLWKRIDYIMSKRVNPLSMKRFGMVTPGDPAPSDHAGIITEFAVENSSAPLPAVSITAPASGATVQRTVAVSASATDSGGITRLEWLLDGKAIAVQTQPPFIFNWDTTLGPNGSHVLAAAASNTAGRRVVSSGRTVNVQNPSGPDDEVVLYAADATIAGSDWTIVNDSTAASGARLQNVNGGAASASSSPSSYAELIFDANAGQPYRLWIRGKATGNSPDHDAAHVQFDKSVSAAGAAIYRIGTTASARVNIEDCTGCGLANWGWQDNEVGREVLGPPIYFAATGPQRLRIQPRDEGLGIDQIVLSAVRYRFGAPGLTLNDNTILPSGGSGTINQPPSVQLTAPVAGMTFSAPASLALAATASDSDGVVTRVEFFVNGAQIGQDTSAPYTLTWSNVMAGQYTLAARAVDSSGAMTVSAGVNVTVSGSSGGGGGADEIVLHVAAEAQILGGWSKVSDATAASGARLQNPDAGAAKLAAPLPSPSLAFDVTFTATAGKPYRLWLRGKALNDKYTNDSVYVQFDNSVTSSGSATWRIGTTSATPVILEEAGGAGVQGWGWADNGYGAGVLGPVVYFASSGTQQLRVQAREDGLGIDQIVLSAVKYLNAAPGATKNDATILPR